MSHAREAKHLCRRLVNLLSAMSQISPNTQDLFTLITQLAHYLKILIRVALTGAIKLERDMGNSAAMGYCLARLNLLAMDNGDPTIARRGDHPHHDPTSKMGNNTVPVVPGDDEQLKKNIDSLTRTPQGFIASTQGVAYGYRSLAVSSWITLYPLVIADVSARNHWRVDTARLPRRGLCTTRRMWSMSSARRRGLCPSRHVQSLARRLSRLSHLRRQGRSTLTAKRRSVGRR